MKAKVSPLSIVAWIAGTIIALFILASIIMLFTSILNFIQ
jgi:hypothetical protein